MSETTNLNTQISKFYKSFSGTDTLAFIMMPGSSPVVIGSLTTVSYSMYRNKKPVINIGRTNINGVTRGSRIFAGTMIFTLINQHWLKELQSQQQLKWLSEFKELKVDELPLFDIMIVSANEYGNYVSMYIYGIDFTDEAQTISVEDLFTENVFSFVARDISNFKAGTIKDTVITSKTSKNKNNDFTQKFFVLDSSTTGLDDLAKLEKDLTLSKIKENKKPKIFNLVRDLYYSTSKTIIGNDVAEVQELLNKTNLVKTPINGIFDSVMDKAVRLYQSLTKSEVNGVVDNKTYNDLIRKVLWDGTALGVVVNKFGAYVHKEPDDKSDIVDVKKYQEQVPLLELITGNNNSGGGGSGRARTISNNNKWYKISSGYIHEEDLYSAYYTGNVIEFPIVEYGDSNTYVTLIQSALSDIYSSFKNITGMYDYETQAQIKKLQEENGMYPSGVVNNDTWLLLQSLSGNIVNKVSDDNFQIEIETLPGIYNISNKNVVSQLSTFNVKVSCDNYTNVKASAIAIYDNNNSETFTKTTLVKNKQTISLSDFKNAFIYNPKYGKEPKQIDFVIYPQNKKPYKWTIMYS